MDNKFALSCGTLYDVDDNTKPALGKFDKPAFIPLVHKNGTQAWEAPFGFMKDILSTITIRNRRSTHDHKQDEPKRVGHEMPLAPFHLFVWVKSFFTAHFCAFDALTIDNANAWFSLSTGFGPYIAAEERVDVLPCAVIAPRSIVIPKFGPN